MQALSLRKTYKKYPEYKDSGVEWLGKIPLDWQKYRFKFVASYQKGKIPNELLPMNSIGHLPYLSMEYLREDSDSTNFAPILGNVVAENEDTILLWDGSNAGEFLEAKKGVVSSTASVVKFKRTIDKRFGYYFSKFFEKYLKDQTTGMGIPHVEGSLVSNCNYLSPPMLDQSIIAKYLDEKTGFIDQIIERKKKLIELLKEKRTAIINQAVTKGLDLKTELVDSGIDWIGKIPKGWRVQKLKFLAKAPLQYGANEVATDENHDQVRFIRITDIDERGNLQNKTFKSLPMKIAHPYLLQDGDILFARTGATVGKTFKYKKEWGACCFAGYLIKMSVNNDKISSNFLEYVTRSNYYLDWVQSIFIKSTLQNVSAEKYKEFLVMVPNKIDQDKIVAILDEKLILFSNALSNTERTIQFLQEFKSSLISNVVTGKVKI